jgi:Subtilase family
MPTPSPSPSPRSSSSLLLLVAALAPACSTDARPDADSPAPTTTAQPAAEVVATRVDVRGPRTLTRQKLRAADGSITSSLVDERGVAVAEDQVPAFTRERIGPELQRALAAPPTTADATARLDVLLVLRGQVEETSAAAQQLDVQLPTAGAPRFSLDGKPSDARTVTALNEQLLDELAHRQKARLARDQDRLRELAARNQWSTDAATDAALAAALAQPQGSLRRSLTRAEIAKLAANSADLVESLELYQASRSSTAGALTSIGVDSWAHNQGVRGDGVGIYMSESGGYCPVSPHIDSARYTNLTGAAEGWHADFVGNILRVTAPLSHIFCGAADSMVSNPASFTPRIHVTNHSWNYYSTDRTYWSQDRDFDDAVYNNRLAVFVSAGNGDQGTNTNVLTPAKAFNVFAVGNYDDATNTMNAGSRFANPTASHEKPDLVAPGTAISTTAGTGTGTSASAPFAAGFAADLLSQHTWLQGHPEALKAMMMAGASRNLEGAAALSDRDGAGGISYLNTAYNGQLTWWVGGNNTWFDANNKLSFTRTLAAGQRYRMALDWLSSGAYAFSNDNVNMDLDMSVKAPAGNEVAGSYSYNNSFEIVDFVAPTTGLYTITINRYWNSGVGDIIMAHHTQAIF